MDPELTASHTLSALLHAVFLVLAFLAPVTMVIEPDPLARLSDRVVRTRTVSIAEPVTNRSSWHVPEVRWGLRRSATTISSPSSSTIPQHRLRRTASTSSPHPRRNPARTSGTRHSFDERGFGDLPDDGTGAREPSPDLARAEPGQESVDSGTSFAEETAALLAEMTAPLGLDADGIAATLDDGGGSNKPAFRGFGLAGSGVTCGSAWKTENEKIVVTRTEPCKGETLASLRGRGVGHFGQRAEPDLGERDGSVDLGCADGEDCVRLVPKVTAGEPTSCGMEAGACDWREAIERVIERHVRELKFCYERTMHRHARPFDAELGVSFAIPPAGGRANVTLTRPTGFGRLDRCAARRMERWIFPAVKTSVRANYPFRFRTPTSRFL